VLQTFSKRKYKFKDNLLTPVQLQMQQMQICPERIPMRMQKKKKTWTIDLNLLFYLYQQQLSVSSAAGRSRCSSAKHHARR
jgi:hypothetical protein